MYRNKGILAWLVLWVVLMFPVLGVCAELPAAIPIEQAAAILMDAGEGKLLLGGASVDTVGMIDDISGVVKLCDHQEHCGAAEEIAAKYGVPVWADGDAIPFTNALWQDGNLQIAIGEDLYVFGAETAQAGAATFDCSGRVVPYKGKTNQSAVNVRKSTSTKSNQVGKLKRGDLLTILGLVLSDNGEYWYQVELNDGKTGYVRADLLSAASGNEPEEEAAVAKKAEGRYIGNKKSKVYHRSSCKSLPSSKNIVYLDSKSYAEAKGYRPCKNCDP